MPLEAREKCRKGGEPEEELGSIQEGGMKSKQKYIHKTVESVVETERERGMKS